MTDISERERVAAIIRTRLYRSEADYPLESDWLHQTGIVADAIIAGRPPEEGSSSRELSPAISALGWRPTTEAEKEACGKAFYLSMYEQDGGVWRGVEERHHGLWIDNGRRFLELLARFAPTTTPPPEHGDGEEKALLAEYVAQQNAYVRGLQAALNRLVGALERIRDGGCGETARFLSGEECRKVSAEALAQHRKEQP